jgi:hypothetical protein
MKNFANTSRGLSDKNIKARTNQSIADVSIVNLYISI